MKPSHMVWTHHRGIGRIGSRAIDAYCEDVGGDTSDGFQGSELIKKIFRELGVSRKTLWKLVRSEMNNFTNDTLCVV